MISDWTSIGDINKMGRTKINEEQIPARLPGGTLDRIDQVLAEKESRAAFIREAVERELKRRERKG
jgi:metal-responsive CopG/Arc/MetJ family transcriptional regulator